MRSVIVNDTHFGFKADSPIMLDYSLRFFEEQLFPYMETNNINTLFHLGDVFDRRKYVNFKTLQQVRTRFFEPLAKRGIVCVAVCGNHDTYFRNKNTVNSLQELVAHYRNWTVISEPGSFADPRCPNIVCLPWVNDENEEESRKVIDAKHGKIMMGHLELAGFQTTRGQFMDTGHDPAMFKEYDLVLSGHYHIKSERDNIRYLGTQYQLSFSDVWETKGFHVLDHDTLDLEFIENPERIFYTIDYDEDNPEVLDYPKYKDCFVKIFIKKHTKAPAFEKFMDKFYEVGTAELSITEVLTPSADTVAVDIHKDTLQLLHEELDAIQDVSVDRKRLTAIMDAAYDHALNEEGV